MAKSKNYANLSGKSPITHYTIRNVTSDDGRKRKRITVHYKRGIYTYTVDSVGAKWILARLEENLNDGEYAARLINRHFGRGGGGYETRRGVRRSGK